MGLDERSRAASDSLASVLAVYDGFCNLKQVRPSLPPKSYRLITSFIRSVFSLAVHLALGFVRCYWPFKALTFSPGFRFQRCSPCVKFWSSPAARQIPRSFQSLQPLCRITRAAATFLLDGHVFLFSFFLQRLQVSGTLISFFFFGNHRSAHFSYYN